ncbi:AAA family ATPase [bacterium]|nr:AAA family ATPase [bacterium]
MVKMEVTKVILTRGTDWALVEYRTSEGRGTCGGQFGCNAAQIVPGQFFRGKLALKRTRNGDRKQSFNGAPVSRTAHALKFALKREGIGYIDRSAIFSQMKPFDSLTHALKHRKSAALMNVPNIGRKKLARLYSAFDAVAQELTMSVAMNKTLPKLHAYLNDNQLKAALKWHDNSMEKLVRFIVADPWRLMYDTEYDSFGHTNMHRSDFLSATTKRSRLKMVQHAATDLKLLMSDPRAKRCEAIHTLKEYMTRTGNYWMPRAAFLSKMDTIKPTWPCVVHDGHVALARYAEIELFLEKTFSKITRTYEQPSWSAPPPDVQLDAHQRRVVVEACESPLFILQGGAGVGKTSVCRHIVKSLNGQVVCAAPTGKAAQRLAEVTGVPAFTVHRLVYMSETSPLPSTLLLDEQSMQEPEILALLLLKRTFNKIIFVGDTAQLTSVGPGQFFRDLCESDMPRIELTHIYRSGPTSFIATNGQKIRNGDTALDTSPESFMVHRYRSDDDIVAHAKRLYEATGDMPMVLCNTNAEISSLNARLRQICNPIGAKAHSSPVSMDYSKKSWRYSNWCFGVGDSVINITNKYLDVLNNDGRAVGKELQVANGEIGTVVKAVGTFVTVKFDRLVKFNIAEEEFLRPAYALTVNKAQGSEYGVVIVKSSSSWGDKRERFYTAVTRAKQKCIVYEVGSSNTDCIRANPARRKTYLLKRKESI